MNTRQIKSLTRRSKYNLVKKAQKLVAKLIVEGAFNKKTKEYNVIYRIKLEQLNLNHED